MTVKTQTELEKPAKVYQLNAVEAKVDLLLKGQDELIKNTSELVTKKELEESEKNITDTVTKYVDSSIEKVHLEYRPVKSAAIWFAGIIIVAVVGLIFTTWKTLTGVE